MWRYLEAWGQVASVFVGLLYIGKLLWFLIKCCCPSFQPWNMAGHFRPRQPDPHQEPLREEDQPRRRSPQEMLRERFSRAFAPRAYRNYYVLEPRGATSAEEEDPDFPRENQASGTGTIRRRRTSPIRNRPEEEEPKEVVPLGRIGMELSPSNLSPIAPQFVPKPPGSDSGIYENLPLPRPLSPTPDRSNSAGKNK